MIIGGTSGIGRTLAESYAGRGRTVVVACRDTGRAEQAAGEIGGATTGIAVDLSKPAEIAGAVAGVKDVEHLVLAAIDCATTTACASSTSTGAMQLVTMKLVGYTEAIHALLPRDARARVDPALRRPRQGPAVPRLDDRQHRQRRRHRDGAHARHRAGADPRQRPPPGHRRRQPGLGGQAAGRARGGARAHAARAADHDERGRRRVRPSCSRTAP